MNQRQEIKIDVRVILYVSVLVIDVICVSGVELQLRM
jgi:preprotein translocase subunit Sec61beta